MKRFHLFEWEDQTWFPDVLRRNMTDYLRFMITRLGIYDPVVPHLKEMLEKTGQRQILDLCSGAGGGLETLQPKISAEIGFNVPVTLTDKFPNLEAWQQIQTESKNAIQFEPQSVDATNVPANLTGVRTLFSSFHHFKPEEAQAILQDAVNKKQAIGIFEGSGKQYHELLLAGLVFPPLMLGITPFIRPFKLSRLFFTYLIPAIPVFTLWDGVVSVLRMYSPEMLSEMTKKLEGPPYVWKTGYARHKSGAKVIYLIGYPEVN
ncbi:class I SAM-dependent methyltransferase [Adhaeribacter sp. BT258]|uniref:Class I SAM-dependent methyltransferase n=1 Tax=Adhaeribacter terrigena TaxID=2793070 RepID=A0ABS1C3Z7_9BACT|nr:class I SAM-dependent methyltransferase [Adhaeribacter terrigena]MBK0404126.1 class I SAM-dependent methyltransferase [Adhaeribacter terrigena]